MNDLSVTKPYQRRRRFSREFKAEIVAKCLERGASVSRISLDNGLNASMVRRWMSEAQRADKTPATPGFVPVNLPAAITLLVQSVDWFYFKMPLSECASLSAHSTRMGPLPVKTIGRSASSLIGSGENAVSLRDTCNAPSSRRLS